MGVRALSLAIWRINIGHHRRIRAAPWSIIASIGPQLPGLRPSAPRIEHGRGCLVGKHPLGSSQSLENVVTQGAQIPGGASHPIGERRSVELDALPGVDLGLPVKWQVIGIFRYQDLRDQRLGRNATLDDPCRSGSLDDRTLARTAAIPRPPGNQDAESGWNDVEALGDILADLVKRTAATGASLALDIDDLFDPFEVRRQ